MWLPWAYTNHHKNTTTWLSHTPSSFLWLNPHWLTTPVCKIDFTGITKHRFLLHVFFISYFDTTYTLALFSPEQAHEGVPRGQCRGRRNLTRSGWSICQPHFYTADPLQDWVPAQLRISRLILLISLLLHSPLHSWFFWVLLFIVF